MLKLPGSLGMCLRRNENVLSSSLEEAALPAKCISDFLFRVTVCPCSVKVPHPAFVGALKEVCGLLL